MTTESMDLGEADVGAVEDEIKPPVLEFLASGFGSTVTACSLTPEVDGYITTFGQHPYQVHPVATPDQWHAMHEAIEAGAVTVEAFVPPVVSVDTARAERLIAMAASCEAAITSGFVSSALGKPHTYPSQQTDQLNLNTTIVSSLFVADVSTWSTLQMCADADGVWAARPHTAVQIRQVGTDCKIAIDTTLATLAATRADIAAAKTATAVLAITW